jgi:hypothetical protein
MEGYHEQDIPLPEGCGGDESGILIGNSYLECTLHYKIHVCLSDMYKWSREAKAHMRL